MRQHARFIFFAQRYYRNNFFFVASIVDDEANNRETNYPCVNDWRFCSRTCPIRVNFSAKKGTAAVSGEFSLNFTRSEFPMCSDNAGAG